MVNECDQEIMVICQKRTRKHRMWLKYLVTDKITSNKMNQLDPCKRCRELIGSLMMFLCPTWKIMGCSSCISYQIRAISSNNLVTERRMFVRQTMLTPLGVMSFLWEENPRLEFQDAVFNTAGRRLTEQNKGLNLFRKYILTQFIFPSIPTCFPFHVPIYMANRIEKLQRRSTHFWMDQSYHPKDNRSLTCVKLFIDIQWLVLTNRLFRTGCLLN